MYFEAGREDTGKRRGVLNGKKAGAIGKAPTKEKSGKLFLVFLFEKFFLLFFLNFLEEKKKRSSTTSGEGKETERGEMEGETEMKEEEIGSTAGAGSDFWKRVAAGENAAR